MTGRGYRELFRRAEPGRELIERTIAAAGEERTPRRHTARRVLAAAACLALVLCIGNYQALAAGVERALRYFAGVGAVEQGEEILVQEGSLSFDDGTRLYLIEGAYQRDGVLTVPVEVISREEPVNKSGGRKEQYLRLTVYAGGEELASVFRGSEGELIETSKAQGTPMWPLSDGSDRWVDAFYLPRGYRGSADAVFLMALPQGAEGPYTFTLEDYGNNETWEGTLALGTPQAQEILQVSRTVGEGTVTALVGADGRSVAFYAELDPALTQAGERLLQLTAHDVWFLDDRGDRYEGAMRRYATAAAYLPEIHLAEEPEGEIVAIEVGTIWYDIVRTDVPMGKEGSQYHPKYEDLGWVIDLSGTD